MTQVLWTSLLLNLLIDVEGKTTRRQKMAYVFFCVLKKNVKRYSRIISRQTVGEYTLQQRGWETQNSKRSISWEWEEWERGFTPKQVCHVESGLFAWNLTWDRCMFTIKEIIILITRFCNSYTERSSGLRRSGAAYNIARTFYRIVYVYSLRCVLRSLPRGTLYNNVVELFLTDNYARIAISLSPRSLRTYTAVYCTSSAYSFLLFWPLSFNLLSSVITEEEKKKR